MKRTNWNELAEEYASRGFVDPEWTRGYLPLLQLLGGISGKNVLDYGCGAGKFTRVLAAMCNKVIAVDPSKKMIEIAKTEDCHRISYHQIINNDISFVDSIDYAVSTYVWCGIEHNNDLEHITQQISNKLVDGGSYIVLDPHPLKLEKSKKEGIVEVCLPGMTKKIHDYWRSVDSYVSILSNNGFKAQIVFEAVDEAGMLQELVIKAIKNNYQ